MFFSYAEKQGSIFSDAWEMREMAFDTMRRYLYYSVPLKNKFIAPANVSFDPLQPIPSSSNVSTST